MTTFVLIPGAWHGGWVWHPVAQRLRAAGHTAVCITMPGLGDGDDPRDVRLSDAVDHVVAEVLRRELRDVVLVAHSWGGVPATGAAHLLPGRVSMVAFFSAFVPQQGVSSNDENSPENAAFVRAAAEASPDGTVSVPFEAFQYAMMQAEPEPLQRLVFELLTPMPGAYLLEALDVGPVTSAGIAAAYVLAEDDQALPLSGKELASRVGVEPVLVPGGHEALLTHPDEVAAALLDAAAPRAR